MIGEVEYLPVQFAVEDIIETDDGKILLKNGLLYPYTSEYSNFVNILPEFSFQTVTNTVPGSQYYSDIFYNSNIYIRVSDSGSISTATMGSLLGTANFLALATITTAYSSCMFGNTYLVSGNAGMNYMFSTATTLSYTALTTGNTYLACAANTTLAVMCSSAGATAGKIYTSTNGNTWTSRTPSGGVATNIIRAIWSPCISKFIYECANNTLYTTTDGYTLASMTPPTGFYRPTQYASYNIASSDTSILLLGYSSNGAYVNTLWRSTNGTSWIEVDLPFNFRNSYLSSQVFIKYISGVYYIFYRSDTNGLSPCSLVSYNDGITWGVLPNVITDNINPNSNINMFYVNNQWAVSSIYRGTAYFSTLNSPTSISHIGTVQNYSTNPLYLDTAHESIFYSNYSSTGLAPYIRIA